MTEENLHRLIEKYSAGTATVQEERTLLDWHRTAEDNDVHWPAKVCCERETVQARMLSRLQQTLFTGKVRALSSSWLRVAAILFIIVGAALFTLYYSTSSYITIENTAGTLKWVDLPDHSRVLLNAATTLRY